MYIEQIYTDCLAEAAYYIESKGEAVVIDPIRDIDGILAIAEKRNAKISYIFETHFHADFISGHLDLANATGAKIVFGPSAKTDFEIHEAFDGEVFSIGDITLTVLHTAGHTLESSCFLLKDAKGTAKAVFTGDTVFVGDVGRPDLAVKSNLSAEQLAEMLYESIETKIKTLPDDVVIYPGHGAGSACGKNMGTERQTTVGAQKAINYAFKAKNKSDFVRLVLDGQTEPPKYFSTDVLLNKSGYALLNFVIEKSLVEMSLNDIKSAASKQILLLDIRETAEFSKSHIPNSINIAPDGQFATWFASLFSLNQEVLLIVDSKDAAKEAIIRLARVGFEKVIGYVENAVELWQKDGNATKSIKSIDASKLSSSAKVLDIRNESEHDTARIEGSLNIPLAELELNLAQLEKNENYHIHCATGYRSVIAASILQKNDYSNIINILGGFEAIEKEHSLVLATGLCPTKKRELENKVEKN